ncbi:hypothetical protein M9H77_29742 [Catharanthus roseus]|uniref:Uncharacterized protein n=1 Tax=Catharanthus roseus TaxID=4058 RepID=A0ACB9ZVB3_CATRO|nr:hypothetical protein M9H77_29742 [Catharanthus roseus]
MIVALIVIAGFYLYIQNGFGAKVESLEIWRTLVQLWKLVVPSGVVICGHMTSLIHFAAQGEFTNLFFYKKFKYFLESIFLYFLTLTKVTKYLPEVTFKAHTLVQVESEGLTGYGSIGRPSRYPRARHLFVYKWCVQWSMKSNIRPVCFGFPASIDYGIPKLMSDDPV